MDSSVDSTADNYICKYYGSPTGCTRGSTCFYWHGEGDLENSKLRVGIARNTVLAEFKRKIFVGGLPPSLDSGKKLVYSGRNKPNIYY